MDVSALRNTPLLAAATFIAATLVLAVQLITPSPIMVPLGDGGTQTTAVGQYFTYSDVAIIVSAAALTGVSGSYLVLHDRAQNLGSRSPGGYTNGRPGTGSGGPDANVGEDITAADADTPEGNVPGRAQREAALDRLKGNEATIYELILDADGDLPQRKLVEETDLSKATVSRTLDSLEHRELVERERTGIGNRVTLT